MGSDALQLLGIMLLSVGVIRICQYFVCVRFFFFQTFAGEYHDIVGTALFFEEDPSPAGSDPVFTTIPQQQLRYVCKTRKALHMSRVFLKRKDSVQDDFGLDPDVDTGENSADKGQEIGPNNVHVSSSDNLTMEVEESPPLPSTKEKEESIRHFEPEPVAGPSWMPDVLDDDVRDFQTLMEATASKNVTHEVSRLVEKQIRIASDSTENSVTDSDNVSDG
jgi:hypothetical protein